MQLGTAAHHEIGRPRCRIPGASSPAADCAVRRSGRVLLQVTMGRGERSPPAPQVALASGQGRTDRIRSLNCSLQGAPPNSNTLLLCSRPAHLPIVADAVLRRRRWEATAARAAAAAARAGAAAAGAAAARRRREQRGSHEGGTAARVWMRAAAGGVWMSWPLPGPGGSGRACATRGGMAAARASRGEACRCHVAMSLLRCRA